MRSRRRRLGSWILGGLGLALWVAACGAPEKGEVPAADERPVARRVLVETRVAEPRLFVDTMNLPADVSPARRAVLAAEVAGTVESVRVDAGARVSAGQTLLEVESRSLKNSLAEAEAVERQRGLQLERAQALFERQSITKQQLLDAVTASDVATARLASARLELDRARLRAPWAGRVAARRVEVGDYVTPGRPVLELLDANRLKVRAAAPASDVPFLRLGLSATVRLDSFPGESFSGSVTRLGAELDAAARTLEVEVEIANADGRLRPGMLARLEIPRRTYDEALLVPLAAVLDYERQRVVYVMEEGRAARRVVELGPSLGDEVVVTTGLAAGEKVIVEGQLQVSSGQEVLESAPAASGEAG